MVSTEESAIMMELGLVPLHIAKSNQIRLSEPTNAFISYGGFTPGSPVAYMCMGRFILRGHRKRYCLANLTWSGFEPSCVALTSDAINCSSLPSTIPNGIIIVSGKIPGSVATYGCNEDYVLVG